MGKKKKKGFISAKDKKKQEQKKVSDVRVEKPLRDFWFSPPRDEFFGWICFFGIVVLSFLMSFHTLTDTDIFWHLKTGEIIIQSGHLPEKDIYSFTREGDEWIDAQWIFQVLVYLSYRVGGISGMVILGSVLTVLTIVLILVQVYDRKRYFRVIFLVLVSLFTVSLRLKLRPEMLTFLFLVLELLLINFYKKGKRWALYFIPVLMMIWVNSQGLWPIGIFILGVNFLELVLGTYWVGFQRYFKLGFASSGKKRVLEMGVCVLASMILVWINPYGFRGIIFPLRLLWEISSSESFIGGYISEFLSPFSMDKVLISPYIFLIIFSGIVHILLIFSRKLYVSDLIIWGVFLYLSATARRNVALFAISVAVLGGMHIVELSAPGVSWLKRISGFLLQLRIFFGLILFSGMIFWGYEIINSGYFIWNGINCQFGGGALETEYPIRASEYMKRISGLKIGRPLRIFTDLYNSGYLIWAGYPDWKVYVDPRMEVYGDDFIKRYASLYNNFSAFIEEDLRYNFDIVAVTSYQPGALNFLKNFYNNPNWTLLYLDGTSVIFIKNHPIFSKVIEGYALDLTNGLNTPIPKVGGKWMAVERNYRGYFLLELKRRELAVEEFKEGLRYDPYNPDLNYNLGANLNRLGRYTEALPYLERYEKLKPGYIPNQVHLAWALANTGETGEAITILQGILNRNPRELSACVKLAKVYEILNKEGVAYNQWKMCWDIFNEDPLRYKSEAYDISESLKRYKGIESPSFQVK